MNLAEIASAFSGSSKIESKYRRIQHFFSNYPLEYNDIASAIGKHLPKGQWTLSMDRTDWQVGKNVINLLVLAVVHNGTAVPLLWTPLDKKGNSDTQERQDLMRRFIKLFGTHRIKSLTADREFIGIKWLAWLLEENIPICIRIKKNTLITISNEEPQSIWKLFVKITSRTKKCLKNVEIWGSRVNIEGMRLKKGEYLIVLSNDTKDIIKTYKKRWNIETMFGNLKRRGFRLEDTHLKDPTRISKLVALLALAYCYVLEIGAWRIEQGQTIRFKKTLKCPLKSIFHHGLEYLRHLILNLKEKLQEFMSLPHFLSCS